MPIEQILIAFGIIAVALLFSILLAVVVEKMRISIIEKRIKLVVREFIAYKIYERTGEKSQSIMGNRKKEIEKNLNKIIGDERKQKEIKEFLEQNFMSKNAEDLEKEIKRKVEEY